MITALELLIKQGIALTEQEAEALILTGKIYIANRQVSKTAELLEEDDIISVEVRNDNQEPGILDEK